MIRSKFPGRRSLRGYTTIELVVALGVFAIGITGVASMQKVTSSSNAHARALATATAIAQAWQEQLAVEGTRWMTTSSDANGGDSKWLRPANAVTVWLADALDTTRVGKWSLPQYVAARSFGPNFSAAGIAVDPSSATGPDQTVFCVHVRANQLLTVAAGQGLVRVDLRVFWPRQGYAWSNGDAYCTTTKVDDIGKAEESFHFVYAAAMLRPTPRFGQ